jgi:uncharacterized protein (DUF2141 family)
MKALSFAAAIISFPVLAVPATAGDVSITVTGAVPNGSRVFVALCSNSLEPSSCHIGESKMAQTPTVKFAFANVEPARYAILAFQDLEGTGILERSKLGLPLEPFALSNNAGRTGKPTFEAAAVTVGPSGGEFQLGLRSLRHGVDQ